MTYIDILMFLRKVYDVCLRALKSFTFYGSKVFILTRRVEFFSVYSRCVSLDSVCLPRFTDLGKNTEICIYETSPSCPGY